MNPLLDQYDVFLFDIDGTLINCTDAVHYFAFCEALTRLAGRPLNLDGVIAHGNTDVGILRDALTLAHVPAEQWRPRLPETRTFMAEFVEARTHDLTITVLPAVPELLTHLRGQGKLLGVATGNLARIGQAKLRAAGLLDFFHFGAYSDTHEYRHEVFQAAIAEARAQAGPNARICILGDTPEDIRAAQANHVDVIAVATGVFPFATLAAEAPTLCLNTLRYLLPNRGRREVVGG